MDGEFTRMKQGYESGMFDKDADKDVHGGRLIRKLILMDGPIGGGNNKDVEIARMQSFFEFLQALVFV